MKKIVLWLATGIFAALLLTPIDALACACCAEKGYYGISMQTPTQYEKDVLKQIKFGASAQLYTDAAGEDNIKGISTIAESYDFTNSMTAKSWSFNFKTGKQSGVLTLPMPTKMLSYKVDLRDKTEGEPVLYKEWRFEGTTAGTGIFKAGIVAPTKYFLVLQGRGNVCDNAEDFTHWRLEITGKKAAYAFLGEMSNS